MLSCVLAVYTCSATLVDTVSTLALVTVSPYSGVSVNLAVTYMSPVPGSSTVTVDSRVVRAVCLCLLYICNVAADGSESPFAHSTVCP